MKAKSPLLNDRQFLFVAACVAGAVLPHMSHFPLLLTALIATIIAAAIAMRIRGRAVAPVWIKLPLVALLPVLVILRYGNIFGREPGSAIVCGMLALKLLETATRRDGRAAVCFASFVLMSALLFDTSLVFTVALFVLAIPLFATLRELESAQFSRSRLPRSLLQSALALAASIPLTLCAFVFFPRLESPLWRTPGDDLARTGMSDSMSPGSIQNLLIDDSPAFRVVFDGTPPPRASLYWRGPVLTNFDGTTWRRREAAEPFNSSRPLQSISAVTAYEVTLEPNDQPWLFALDAALGAAPDSRQIGDLSILRSHPVTELLRYRMQSALDYRLDISLSAEGRRQALALPADFNPRSVELAAGWRRDLGSNEAVIEKSLELFHADFSYTLAAPPLGRDSIDDFVFNTRRGFCEHYAAAFVFLMRGAGIPARVVTGYLGGFFNVSGNYLLVRQSDAHAWAEVWLAEKGWVRVDPTAAVSPQRIELGSAEAAGPSGRWYQSDWIRGLRNQLDLVNRGWNNLVVQFNTLRQQDLLSSFGIDKADYATLTGVLITTSSLLLLAAAAWVVRAPRRRIDPLDRAYDVLCKKLARTGVRRDPAEGPIDFASRTRVADARTLLNTYVNLRYAVALPGSQAVSNFSRAVRKWRP